jgi:hypothetical protein
VKNAHVRFGWLTYVKSTEKTTTSIKLRLDRFIGEVPGGAILRVVLAYGAVSADRSLLDPLTSIREGHFAVGMKESPWPRCPTTKFPPSDF